jgi:hypothetical protein
MLVRSSAHKPEFRKRNIMAGGKILTKHHWAKAGKISASKNTKRSRKPSYRL